MAVAKDGFSRCGWIECGVGQKTYGRHDFSPKSGKSAAGTCKKDRAISRAVLFACQLEAPGTPLMAIENKSRSRISHTRPVEEIQTPNIEKENSNPPVIENGPGDGGRRFAIKPP